MLFFTGGQHTGGQYVGGQQIGGGVQTVFGMHTGLGVGQQIGLGRHFSTIGLHRCLHIRRRTRLRLRVHIKHSHIL